MTTDDNTGQSGPPELVAVCSACRRLNDQRINLDRRITMLPADDHRGDRAWLELEDVLEQLEDAAERLVGVSATELMQVRAKAEVLAILMRSDEADGESIVPVDKTRALTLSLVDDLAGLPGGSVVAEGRCATGPPVAVRPAKRAFERWLLSKYLRPCRIRCH
jgi:hypothetical protein